MRSLLKLATWRQIQKSPNLSEEVKAIRPGQSLEKLVHFVFRDREYPVSDRDDFINRKRRHFTRPQYEIRSCETFREFHRRLSDLNELDPFDGY